MKLKLCIWLLLIIFPKYVISAEYHMFFLGGQSNMDGYGYINQLPQNLKAQQNVMIFHGNGVFDNKSGGGVGMWEKLKPGHGTGFKSDGNTNRYSERFGAELSFASALKDQFPNKKIALIKYAVGGTGLHLKTGYGNWSPDFREGGGMNQYDFFLNTVKNAFAISDIDGDGVNDTLTPAGIIWMQGEADAHSSKEAAYAYFNNLTRLMNLIRAAFRDDSIPVVLGKITDSELGDEDIMPYIDSVHLAQQMFIEQDACAAYMTKTETYPYNKEDVWHYSSEGYVRMGEDFAKAYAALIKRC
ncbi:sialate O-acetylesterase [Agarilytica rhodophyticola]|uniref:sialate O-acetylesterase n=1 Tax=Agarilytica rhodophyticola TaxID=1737490 RepID=UPI000CD82968|nr:sialate O-acetylesterase [Agarilytica rhodophyticola]